MSLTTFFNFFFKEEPWFPPKEGYTFIQSVGEESLIHGTRGPATKKECEVRGYYLRNWKLELLAKRPFSTFSFLCVSWSSDRVQRKSFLQLAIRAS